MKKSIKITLIASLIVISCLIAIVSPGSLMTVSRTEGTQTVKSVYAAPIVDTGIAYDVNGDGKVNIRDAATLLLYLDGKNGVLN